MANEILSSSTTTDQETLIQAKLLARANLDLVAASICEKVQQPKGAGKTAYFVRYQRMNVPLAALSEGVDPSNSTFSLQQVTVTLDQWGDVLTITDVAVLTTKHPLVQQALDLMADNAQRVIDREVQVVWLAGTNVQYGDGSVTSRSAITSSMKISDTVIHKAVVTLRDGGAAPRGGPYKDAKGGSSGTKHGGKHFVAVAGPHVIRDIMATSTSLGTWASIAMYNDPNALYNGEVGSWLGLRWVETNFIPKFSILGNTTAAVSTGNAFGTDTPVVSAVDGGGSLTSSTTYYFKVTRKDKTRGFEEAISIRHSMSSAATGDNESFTFNFSSLTAGYAYNLYFGSSDSDSALKLVEENIEVGDTVTVTSVPSSTTTAPANVNTTGTPTIHPVYIHGNESCAWVGLQNLEVKLSGDGATTHNPLGLRRTIGWKFMGKAVIKNQSFLLRLEVASTY